ncbi:hypothetical protein [Methylobacterium radiotolerans]|uniref:hypothetical protein n=1 Tax=Methylobacterium radiotolerans TaxID=31998 RepID=UPI0038D0A8B8
MVGEFLNFPGARKRINTVAITYLCISALLIKGSLVSSYGSESHMRNISIVDIEPAQSLRTIQLKCPDDNSGILQQVRKDEKGRIAKTRYKYEGGSIAKIIDELADPGKGFQVVGTYKSDSSATKEEKREALRLIEQVRPFSDSICMHSNKKPLYEIIIEINRGQLRGVEYDKTAEARSPLDGPVDGRAVVGVRCPQNTDFGILERVNVISRGYVSRTRYVFQGGEATHAILESARPTGPWKFEEGLYLNRMTSPKDAAMRTKLRKQVMVIIDNYCQNPENKKHVDIKINQVRRNHKEILKEILNGGGLDGIDWLKADIR